MKSPVYFRIEAYKGYQAGAGVISTIFPDAESAKRYKQSLIEQRGYSASDIYISTTDKDGRAVRL